MVSDVGTASYLPALVRQEDLIEGNSKLELSSSVANIGGNALGGAILQALTAGFAVLLNAVSYLLSALFTGLIRQKGETTEPVEPSGSVWQDTGEGLRFVVRQPAIRVMVVATLIMNFCSLALEPLFLVFLTRSLELDPAFVGVIFSASGVGALLGALVAGPLSRWFGVGPVIVVSTALVGVASILVPVATLMPMPAAVTLLVAMQVVDAAMVITCNINLRSYRAAVTPDALQGRMNASIRTVVMGVAPLGGVFGGLLGGWLSITLCLVLVSAGVILSAVVVAFSPIRRVRNLTELSSEPETTHRAPVVTSEE